MNANKRLRYFAELVNRCAPAHSIVQSLVVAAMQLSRSLGVLVYVAQQFVSGTMTRDILSACCRKRASQELNFWSFSGGLQHK